MLDERLILASYLHISATCRCTVLLCYLSVTQILYAVYITHEYNMTILAQAFNYMSKEYTVIVRNHFFWDNSAKSESIETKLDVGSRGTLPYKVLAPFAEQAQNGAKKPHFANFLSPKQHIVSATSWCNLNTKRESGRSWILSEQNFAFVSKRGHFPRKPHFMVFGGTLAARGLQTWPLGLRRI